MTRSPIPIRRKVRATERGAAQTPRRMTAATMRSVREWVLPPFVVAVSWHSGYCTIAVPTVFVGTCDVRRGSRTFDDLKSHADTSNGARTVACRETYTLAPHSFCLYASCFSVGWRTCMDADHLQRPQRYSGEITGEINFWSGAVGR